MWLNSITKSIRDWEPEEKMVQGSVAYCGGLDRADGSAFLHFRQPKAPRHSVGYRTETEDVPGYFQTGQLQSGGLVSGEHPNFLLQAILDAGINALEPHRSVRQVSQGQQIADTGETVPLVYFPHSAVLSCVVGLEGGGAVAGGLIGRDGAFGALQVLDSMVALNKVNVMVPGTVSVVEARHVTSAAEKIPPLRRILLGYEQYFLAQVQQTAACNALHDIPMRTCRWLLRLEQLAGSEFPLTHDALGLMMGVRRTSVTQVAGKMQDAGLLSYHRGTMKLIDVKAMRKLACECHRALEDHYDQMFRRITDRTSVASTNMEAWEQATHSPNVDHQSEN